MRRSQMNVACATIRGCVAGGGDLARISVIGHHVTLKGIVFKFNFNIASEQVEVVVFFALPRIDLDRLTF